MTISRVLAAEHAAIATEQPLATLAGYDVLKSGGNAFDAAVAASFALAVTFHPGGGLGGDFFVTFYESKTGKVRVLNSSGWSPSGLTSDLVNSKGGIQLFGPTSCVIPGLIAGVFAMHKACGTMEFGQLLSSPTKLATDGFPAGEGLCRSTNASLSSLPAESKSIFAPSGRPPVVGEWIRQTDLGRVISAVADGGPDAFYKGWPGEKIAETLTGLGVPTNKQDLDFNPEWVEPLSIDYRGTKIYEVPPNSMGATALLMLKLLSEWNLKAGPLSAERVRTTMKAARFAYDRKDLFLGDPRFGAIDLEKFLDTNLGRPGAIPSVRDGDTTAFSVVDKEGNIASCIQSLFHHFGSRVFVPGTGIFLNNRAAGFSMRGPNKVAPKKRPLHTLSSIITEKDGRPVTAIGASGGEYRPMQHTLFVTNIVDHGMFLEQSVDHPRFLWSQGGAVIIESGYEPTQVEGLEVHPLPYPGRTGVCQAVEISGRSRKAVCDVRGDGVPAGL